MDEKILFFDVVLFKRVWGGFALNAFYLLGEEELVGEAWVLSGHISGNTVVTNGPNKGKKLNDLYLEKPELFGRVTRDRFPLLIKIIDAQGDLSVQVHPNDKYALKHHNDLGKNECWYILDAQPGTYIYAGINAESKEEVQTAIEEKRLERILNKVHIHKGEFYFIEAGQVHAIGEGSKILEIQQSSDTTYRLYDYNRPDDSGNMRELHVDQALEVMSFEKPEFSQEFEKYGPVERLVTNKYFTVDRINAFTTYEVKQNKTYTILFANKDDIRIFIDDKKYVLKCGYTAIITANVKSFKLNSIGEVFVIRERPHKLHLTYIFKEKLSRWE